MIDIPKMLRAEALVADEDWTGIYQISPNLAFAAADRIERLEDELHHCFHRINDLQAALRGVISVADRDCPEFRFARKALDAE